MQVDECYRVLELPVGAPAEDVKRAYRDLTKVWHPDRFAHDPMLQQKAQEKLKQINEAYETLQSAPDRPRSAPPRRGMSNARMYSFVLTFIGFLILFRRPTLGGLIVAAVCFVIAIALGARRR